MIELFKDIATVVGCLSACIGLATIVCKPLRKGIVTYIRSKAGSSKTEEQISNIHALLTEHISADSDKRQRMIADRNAILCLLRNSITQIYYAYLPTKKIPAYEHKNIVYLAESYGLCGGNSYIEDIVRQMDNWEILPE